MARNGSILVGFLGSLLLACGHPAASGDAGESPADAGSTLDAGGPAGAGDGGGLCGQTPGGFVSLPADDGSHAAPIEWWYWTGHLSTPDGGRFGFEEVFFSMASGSIQGQAVHHAVTDVGGDAFHYGSSQTFGAPPSFDGGFDLALDGVTAQGGGGHDVLHDVADAYTLDLTLDAQKPAVLQYDGGYEAYPFGGDTYYYSRERMAATGTLTVGGDGGAVSLPVQGQAWFDHQWGSLGNAVSAGWDWFAIQLDDDRELMLFQFRTNGSQALASGSYTDAACEVTQLGQPDFQIASTGTWKSPHDGCTYPSGWTVKVEGMTLTITPSVLDQELQTADTTYWEGDSVVSGDATGRAYVELTGYCP